MTIVRTFTRTTNPRLFNHPGVHPDVIRDAEFTRSLHRAKNLEQRKLEERWGTDPLGLMPLFSIPKQILLDIIRALNF